MENQWGLPMNPASRARMFPVHESGYIEIDPRRGRFDLRQRWGGLDEPPKPVRQVTAAELMSLVDDA